MEKIPEKIMLAIAEELDNYGPCRIVFWATSLMGLCLMGGIIAIENADTRNR
jgi:hypothetical protein